MTQRETDINSFCISDHPSIFSVSSKSSYSQNNASRKYLKYLNANVKFLNSPCNQQCPTLYVRERFPQPPDIFWRRFCEFWLLAIYSNLRCLMHFRSKREAGLWTCQQANALGFQHLKILNTFPNSSLRNRSPCKILKNLKLRAFNPNFTLLTKKKKEKTLRASIQDGTSEKNRHLSQIRYWNEESYLPEHRRNLLIISEKRVCGVDVENCSIDVNACFEIESVLKSIWEIVRMLEIHKFGYPRDPSSKLSSGNFFGQYCTRA